MEPSAKLLDDIKVRGNTLKTDTLGRFQNAAQRAKNFLLGPPPPQPQLRRRQRREYVKRVKSDTPEVPMAVYSGGESREYEEIFASEEKTPSEPAQTATPDPEPVYSDLNLPELIDDVRRLREEIMVTMSKLEPNSKV